MNLSRRSPGDAAAEPAGLVGRSDELAAIDDLLGGHGPAALLLRGDPGTGRSALLDVAAGRAAAAGARILRVTGAPSETGIEFSGLHQLLYGVRGFAELLGADRRAVLGHILGERSGPAPEPLVTASAVLALLGEVAADRPLLILVDDVQWVDRRSATVLGLVARRIAGTPAAFLAAVRAGARTPFDLVRLPDRTLGPLAAPSAAALLDANAPGLPGVVRRRLLADAAGNPLALLELPAALSDRQRTGRAALPEFLPLGPRLEATFGCGLARLAVPLRGILLLASLDCDSGLATIGAAAGHPVRPEDLADAQQAGLLLPVCPDGRVVFRHPLVRAAVVQLAGPAERRGAHLALAEAHAAEPDRRAWHLAAAATGPDETVARALDEMAMPAWRGGSGGPRSNAAAAVSALVRAGQLSTQPAQRSRRLVEAAFLANVTGRLDQVPELLSAAGQAPDTATGLVFAATAHLLTNGDGDVDAAHRLLSRALDHAGGDVPAGNGWDAYGILYALLFVSVYSGRPESWELLRVTLARFDSEDVAPLRICYDAYVHPAEAVDPVRARLDAAFEGLSTDPAPWQFIPLAYAAVQLDALGEHRRLCERVIDRQRDDGVITVVIVGQLMLAVDSIVHGRWDEAERLATDALEVAAADGYQLLQGQLRCRLALIAASRGDAVRARTLTDEVTGWAAPRGVDLTEALAWQARTIAALGAGDYEEAYAVAGRVDPPGAPGCGVPGRWMILDLVDAAVHIGRTAVAREHVAAAQRLGLADISPRTRLHVAGAAALVADDADAGPLFAAALALPGAGQWPFERARIRLAHGEWLRRTRDTARARLELRDALESLERLGARPWADRARNELRATGVATGRRAGVADVLTPQERQIATLAATGLTNKQIGERLFLSHRTVGAHLHRLFPKLGITSRAALREALEAEDPTPPVR